MLSLQIVDVQDVLSILDNKCVFILGLVIWSIVVYSDYNSSINTPAVPMRHGFPDRNSCTFCTMHGQDVKRSFEMSKSYCCL
ncbi:unnamed protein product [Acanthoscelides obtectus]|uniref:Uncharacterized protein n=1 Tax=Acanthoscelides obtectus TaxID=200917 RepID=A0A9P0Q893_ACAOB|nr:unnamed protein product [Acanthoscelides obtectus]CAK1641449.1 hypothetical protein AOBTE_LOCUS12410 [Acanthoscelides obtectus]